MKTRISNFIKEIKTPDKVLIILLVASIILPKYYSITNKLFIEPLGIDQMESNVVLDVVFGVTFVIALAVLFYKLCNSKFLTAKSLIVSAIVFVWYMGMYRCNTKVYLSSFGSPLTFLKYTDVLLFSLFIFVSKYVYKPKPKLVADESQAFIEDRFSGKTEHDLLGRTNLAAQVVYSILATPQLEESLVIGINAPWGYGKTAFMKLMQNLLTKPGKLKKYKTIADNNNEPSVINNEVRVVEYSLWKNLDNKLLVEDFLETISEQIEEYDDYLAKDILKYAKSVSKVVGGGTDTLMEEIYSLFNKPQSLKKQFDHINNTLGKQEKKLVIFIDDLDRLNGDELVEVFKLIRNTANFKNVFFVVAYDYNYVLNAIGKHLQIENKEEYLRKIIQVDVPLSVGVIDNIESYIIKRLKDFVNPSDLEYIEQAIDEIKYDFLINRFIKSSADKQDGNVPFTPFEFLFNNIREVNKLINSFRYSYQIGRLYLFPCDLFFIEIIKIKFPKIYSDLQKPEIQKKFLTQQESKKWGFDLNKFHDFYANRTGATMLIIVNQLVFKLFTGFRNTNKNYRLFSHIDYFNYYFNSRIPNFISLEKLDEVFKNDRGKYDPNDDCLSDIFSLIDDNLENSETLIDILNYSKESISIINIFTFEKQFKTLFYLTKINDDNIREDIVSSLYGTTLSDQLLPRIYKDPTNHFIDTLHQILTDNTYNIKGRVEFVVKMLQAKKNEQLQSHLHNLDLTILIELIIQELEFKINTDGFDAEVFKYYGIITKLDLVKDEMLIKKCNDVMFAGIKSKTYSYMTNYFLCPNTMFDKNEYRFDEDLNNYITSDAADKKAEYLKIFESEQVKKQFEDSMEFYYLLIDKFREHGCSKSFYIYGKDDIIGNKVAKLHF